MKTYLDCVPCFVRQTLEASRMVTDDSTIHEKILRAVIDELNIMSFQNPPPLMAQKIHKIVREMTNNKDPYKKIKKRFNKFILKLYPDLKKKVEESVNPFETAVCLAIAGNIIDFGVTSTVDEAKVNETIDYCLAEKIAANYLTEFEGAVSKAENIYYLGDNAGEIVFDKLLIEQLLPKKVTFVVKGGPIINDVTFEDAEDVGITDLAKVVDNGSDAPGTILDLCSDEFKIKLNEADLIISKGQANYESLSDQSKNIIFLLKAKCPVITRDIGCNLGDMVLKIKKQ